MLLPCCNAESDLGGDTPFCTQLSPTAFEHDEMAQFAMNIAIDETKTAPSPEPRAVPSGCESTRLPFCGACGVEGGVDGDVPFMQPSIEPDDMAEYRSNLEANTTAPGGCFSAQGDDVVQALHEDELEMDMELEMAGSVPFDEPGNPLCGTAAGASKLLEPLEHTLDSSLWVETWMEEQIPRQKMVACVKTDMKVEDVPVAQRVSMKSEPVQEHERACPSPSGDTRGAARRRLQPPAAAPPQAQAWAPGACQARPWPGSASAAVWNGAAQPGMMLAGGGMQPGMMAASGMQPCMMAASGMQPGVMMAGGGMMHTAAWRWPQMQAMMHAGVMDTAGRSSMHGGLHFPVPWPVSSVSLLPSVSDLEDLLDKPLARQAPVPRPLIPSFLLLAGARPLVFAGSDTGVNLCGCTAMRTSSCLTPRIVVPSCRRRWWTATRARPSTSSCARTRTSRRCTSSTRLWASRPRATPASP